MAPIPGVLTLGRTRNPGKKWIHSIRDSFGHRSSPKGIFLWASPSPTSSKTLFLGNFAQISHFSPSPGDSKRWNSSKSSRDPAGSAQDKPGMSGWTIPHPPQGAFPTTPRPAPGFSGITEFFPLIPLEFREGAGRDRQRPFKSHAWNRQRNLSREERGKNNSVSAAAGAAGALSRAGARYK